MNCMWYYKVLDCLCSDAKPLMFRPLRVRLGISSVVTRLDTKLSSSFSSSFFTLVITCFQRNFYYHVQFCWMHKPRVLSLMTMVYLLKHFAPGKYTRVLISFPSNSTIGVVRIGIERSSDFILHLRQFLKCMWLGPNPSFAKLLKTAHLNSIVIAL